MMKAELIDHMGSDLSVVNAARVSFEKESRKFSDKDAKLLRYLATHNHWTPFAHTALSFRIKAPIFVARQLAKHQIGLVWNEVSRRYVDSPPEFYTPEVWRARADNVKQGSAEEAALWQPDSAYKAACAVALLTYENMLNGGVCPEMARMVLPVSMMTEWIWTGSLVAFHRICKLRLDPHTQKETQQLAKQIFDACQETFPHSWSALND
jgi:thymidylate synthase (FAD)